MTAADLTFFRTPADLRAWFAQNAGTARELHAGFYKKGSGEPSVTWSESVDEALCVGWIDGVRRNVDEQRYTIRFTPRKQGSIWSAVNMRKVEVLTREGRMQPAGIKAYEARRVNRVGIYSYEQRGAELPEPYRGTFQANAPAWEFFQAQPPGYRKLVTWRVVSAKQEATRLKRLEQLIAASAQGSRL